MIQDPTLRRSLVDIFTDMQNKLRFALSLWEQGMSCDSSPVLQLAQANFSLFSVSIYCG